MKLVIFDMDQTLVDFISVHNQATHELFCRWFNVDAWLTEIDFAGKALLDNFFELALLKGLPEDQFANQGQQAIEEYEQIFSNMIPSDAKNHILPGVMELLERLSSSDVPLAL